MIFNRKAKKAMCLPGENFTSCDTLNSSSLKHAAWKRSQRMDLHIIIIFSKNKVGLWSAVCLSWSVWLHGEWALYCSVRFHQDVYWKLSGRNAYKMVLFLSFEKNSNFKIVAVSPLSRYKRQLIKYGVRIWRPRNFNPPPNTLEDWKTWRKLYFQNNS